jgi:hypothetical protein
MALTKVQIISAALQVLGKKGISSLGLDDISNSAETAFDFLLPAELQATQWRFASTLQRLSQVVITLPPEIPWSYVYALPGDYLKLITLYPAGCEFEIYKQNQVYTNISSSIWLEYVYLVDAVDLPAYFVKYFIYALASWLCATNAQNPALTASIKQDMKDFKMEAMAIDANNRPQTPIQSRPMISNRFVSTVVSG